MYCFSDNNAVEVEESFNDSNDDELNDRNSYDRRTVDDRESQAITVDTARAADIKLIRYLNVETIADLMVENKKVKYGLK